MCDEEWVGGGAKGDALVSLAEEVGPVGEAAGHEAGVDEAEGLVVDPDVFCVVDEELEVRWYAVTISFICVRGAVVNCFRLMLTV